MSFRWTASLAVGVPLIDEQHRELLDQVDELLEAMTRGAVRGEVETLLELLGDYVVAHFGEEERLMVRYLYPDRLDHVRAHARFFVALGGLGAQLARTGPNGALAVQLSQTAYGWLREHIETMDRDLGQFLQDRTAASAA